MLERQLKKLQASGKNYRLRRPKVLSFFTSVGFLCVHVDILSSNFC
jgi:hypothetical protein